MGKQIATLQAANAAYKQQLADLQAKYEALQAQLMGKGSGATVSPYILAVDVVDGGLCSSTPKLKVVGGGGEGASLICSLSDRCADGQCAVKEVKVVMGGFAFSSEPAVMVSGDACNKAPVFRARISKDKGVQTSLRGLQLVSNGQGYRSPPRIDINGGGGSGATATAIVTDGRVTGVTLDAFGNGYQTTPLVKVVPTDGGSGAQIRAVLQHQGEV